MAEAGGGLSDGGKDFILCAIKLDSMKQTKKRI